MTDKKEAHNQATHGEGSPFAAEKDRVAMVSIAADGSIAQTPDYEHVGDPEAVKAATAEQFRQRAVSVEDQRLRGELARKGEMGTPPFDAERDMDPRVKELQDAHKATEKAATAAAESAVDAHHPESRKSGK